MVGPSLCLPLDNGPRLQCDPYEVAYPVSCQLFLDGLLAADGDRPVGIEHRASRRHVPCSGDAGVCLEDDGVPVPMAGVDGCSGLCVPAFAFEPLKEWLP